MSQPIVLVVEDEADIRDSLVQYLRRALDGVAVLGAEGARQAIHMLSLSPVDLILTDHFMPDGRGTDVLVHASKEHPRTIRMLMTAFPESDVLLDACNEAHVQHIFTKPLEPSEVALDLSRALEAGEHFQKAVHRAGT